MLKKNLQRKLGFLKNRSYLWGVEKTNTNTTMTIAQQLGIKTSEFPFEIKDKHDNIIYREFSDGRWWMWKYDDKGNEIYFKDHNNYWCRSEYNKNGDQVYFKDSNNCWEEKEYDIHGNEVYYGNSDGFWIKREFNEQGDKIINTSMRNSKRDY